MYVHRQRKLIWKSNTKQKTKRTESLLNSFLEGRQHYPAVTNITNITKHNIKLIICIIYWNVSFTTYDNFYFTILSLILVQIRICDNYNCTSNRYYSNLIWTKTIRTSDWSNKEHPFFLHFCIIHVFFRQQGLWEGVFSRYIGPNTGEHVNLWSAP